jgi:DNA-binding response OmpR family regulator
MAEDLPIGELLVRRGVVSRAAVEEAARGEGSRLCSRLLEAGVCDERDLVAALASRLGMPGVDLSRTAIDLAVLELVPRGVAQADLVLPLSSEGDRIHLAVDSVHRAEQALAELRFVTGREVSVYVAVLSALEAAIAASYDARERGESIWRGAQAGPGLAGFEAAMPESPGGEALVPAGDEPFADIPDIEVVHAAEGEVVHSVQVEPGPPRILVVDDEPAIRLLAQRALQGKGYVVDGAADGAEALEKVRRTPPDLLLLDAMLPKVHGFDVARQVRSDPRTRSVPIIIMTAVYRGWRFAQDARDSYGAEDYLEKPFRIDDLLRRVEVVLEATATRDDARQAALAAPFIARGKELLAAGKPAEAAAALEQALKADPFSAEAHFQLGRSLRARGDAFRAMTALERAVDLRPTFFPALRALASLYLEKGFRNKAAGSLERAIQAAPDGATREATKAELLKLL